MNVLISRAYNTDTVCAKLKFSDGSMIAIDAIVLENEVANTMYERFEPGCLIYNDPAAYAGFVLNGI